MTDRISKVRVRSARYVMAALVAMLIGTTVTMAQRPAKTTVRNLQFRLYLNEVFPEAVTAEEGWYTIGLINGVSTAALSLTLDDNQGRRVGDKTTLEKAGRSQMLVYLGPGKHVFRVAGNAKWRTEITVTGKR